MTRITNKKRQMICKLEKNHGRKGFTLIEVMVTVAMIGIFMAILTPMIFQNDKFAESEVALQSAIQSLHSEVELLRIRPYSDFKAGELIPFDSSVEQLSELVAGRGEVKIEKDPVNGSILLMRVEVHWNDPRFGMRSIHTVLLKTPR